MNPTDLLRATILNLQAAAVPGVPAAGDLAVARSFTRGLYEIRVYGGPVSLSARGSPSNADPVVTSAYPAIVLLDGSVTFAATEPTATRVSVASVLL